MYKIYYVQLSRRETALVRRLDLEQMQDARKLFNLN